MATAESVAESEEQKLATIKIWVMKDGKNNIFRKSEMQNDENTKSKVFIPLLLVFFF